jgi:hypothetical protein
MVLRFELTNRSDKRLSYFRGNSSQPIGGFHFLLVKDGNIIPLCFSDSPPGASRSNISSLASGASLSWKLSLKDYGVNQERGNLPPGRYELRADYSMPKDTRFVREMGLTPMEINETVLLIDLVEENSARWPPYVYVMGAVVALGVLGLAWRRYGFCRSSSPSTVESGQPLNGEQSGGVKARSVKVSGTFYK